MKKQINKKFLSEGYGSMLRDLANEKEDYVNEHPDYFMYETDDLEEFDTLEDAIAYAKKCAECNTITRVQIGYEEDGPEFDDEVVWTREEGKLVEKLLKEGTSNFYSLKGGLPLLVFYTIDEIYYQMDNDDENPRNHEDDYESDEALEDAYEEFKQKFFDSLDVSVLDEDDVDKLNNDLSDLNGELQSISYDLYDEYGYLNSDDERYDDKKVSHMLDQSSFLEDIKFGVKPGYYSAAQIYCEGDMYFEDLDKEYQDLILKRLKELQKKYHLSRLGVSYRFSNGETGYHKIEESKKKSLKESKEPLYRVVKNGQGKYFILKRVNDGNTFKNDHSKETFNTPEEAKAAMENPSKLSFHFNEGASYRGLAYYEYPKGSGCHVRETPEVFVAISESGKTLGQDKMKTGAESIIDEYLKKKNESIEGTPKASDYKKLAKKHQKTNKKGARGTFERVANTDPKKNMEIFNHMMGSDVSTSGEASVGVSEAKKPLSNKEIDAKVKRNQKYLNHINKEKEQKSKGEKPIKESRDEERVANYQKDLDELGATEEECNKFIKIADDYEEKAQRHFITYDQMDEVAKAMGLKEMSDKELARAWKVCYYTLNREAFKEDDSEDLKRYAKYSDTASAFAEVINREARERKEKGNYDPTKDESLKKGSRKNIKEEK